MLSDEEMKPGNFTSKIGILHVILRRDETAACNRLSFSTNHVPCIDRVLTVIMSTLNTTVFDENSDEEQDPDFVPEDDPGKNQP